MSRPHHQRAPASTVAAAVALLVTSLTAATHPGLPPQVTVSEELMGATFSIVLEGDDAAALEAAGRAALAEAARIDRLLSNYRRDSEWSLVNRAAATSPVRVSEELFELVERCLAYSRETDGAFDITIGPLMRAWRFFNGEGAIPDPDDLARARASVGDEKVRLDAIARTIAFTHPGTEIDPGGIGKGYAVDRMVAVLRDRGVAAALISAGGSSLYGMGAPADSPDGWRVTIRPAGDPRAPAEAVRLRNQSLSTSGGAEKFFISAGRRYAHIMDPRTGWPARGAASVSVIAPRTIDSEAWAKPYFINGRDWTNGHIQPGWRVYYCDEEMHCVWVER